ncbi:MAG: glucose-6-phosphate isomerase [bacterium]|nr:glucose-6-phosphate isomerase [bacterium]
MKIAAGKIERQYERMVKRGVEAALMPLLMQREASVFGGDAALEKLIGNRLGWVDVALAMRKQVKAISSFGESAIKSGIDHVVLMGMGGSSLCPEVFNLMFGTHPKLTSFHVLDSTDPNAITAVARAVDLKRTLFIVASKSGGTIETRSQEAYFLARLRELQVKTPGRQFVAITDPGSGLEAFAKANKYRKIFLNPADIGGRYSALSLFGLVPGFFAGVDLGKLLDDAREMQEMIAERGDESNPALALGGFMAAGWKEGVDKMTIVASKKTAPFVPWIEQLVAESTGKKGRGVVPIEAEPVGAVDSYGSDRMYVFLKLASETAKEQVALKRKLQMLRAPVVEITLPSVNSLGGQFLLWEAATAAAGFFMGINPFDEPNVTESKENTKAILEKYSKSRRFPLHRGAVSKALTLVTLGEGKGKAGSVEEALSKFFAGAKPNKYVAILNYFKSDRRTESILAEMRATIRDATGCATLRGYGPRFLHSIGQLYKGGDATGMFIVLVRRDYGKAVIPNQPFGFGELITAQAIGDSQALIKRKLPTVVIEVDGSPAEGLEQLYRHIKKIVSK